MPFAARLPKVGDRREYFNERTWRCYHQTPPLERVVAQVWDAGQAKPHLEHNPLAPLGVCHAIPIRKLNGPGLSIEVLDKAHHPKRHASQAYRWHAVSCPGSIAFQAGSSVWHWGMACGQRG